MEILCYHIPWIKGRGLGNRCKTAGGLFLSVGMCRKRKRYAEDRSILFKDHGRMAESGAGNQGIGERRSG